MSIHDCTKVKAGIFHGFHVSWLGELRKALNNGVLPPKYYADAEQYSDNTQADVLTLHESPPSFDPLQDPSVGGVATLPAIAARTHRTAEKEGTRPLKTRHLVIRHISGHRPVAFVEVVSPTNFDRRASRAEFVQKVRSNVSAGLHVTVLNLFPPKPNRRELCAMVWRGYDRTPVTAPTGKPLTFGAFVAKKQAEACFEFLAVGDELPAFPLFLTGTHFIPLPLTETYAEAFAGSPQYLRDLLSGANDRERPTSN